MGLSTRDIRRRIKSIKNTAQITKAMEMVAASKMRKAQDSATRTRNYSEHALILLSRISERIDQAHKSKYPLLNKREEKKTLLVAVSSNRGLCGGLNTNVVKKAVEFIEDRKKNGVTVDTICVGKKIHDALAKMKYNVIASFHEIGDSFSFLEVSPITKMSIDSFINMEYDRVVMVYPHFSSTISQIPIIKRIMPLGPEIMEYFVHTKKKDLTTEEEYTFAEYKFEPSPEAILTDLLPRLVEIEMYQALLEANASEHSARMVAMKNANEAAKDMIDDLTLTYNKARQTAITTEISEIVGGVAALEAANH